MWRANLRRQRGLERPYTLERRLASQRVLDLNLSTYKELEVVHEHGVHALAIDSTEGRYLLAGGQDKALAIFDTACTGFRQPNGDKTQCKAVCTIANGAVGGHKYNIETVQWYPFDTGVFSTSGMDGSLKVWDTNTLQVVMEFANLPGGKVYDHAMSPIAGHGLIAVGAKHNRVKLCDPSSGSATHELSGHKSDVLAVGWSPVSEYLLATGGRDSRVILWDIRTAGPLHVLDQHNGGQAGASSFVVTSHSGEVNGVSFLPNGLHLVTAGRDHRIRLWNTSTGKNTNKHYPRVDNIYQKKIKMGISAMTKQPLVFCPSRSDIVVLDVYRGTVEKKLQGHYSMVHACVFHPTMHEMYSGSNDEEVLVWTPPEPHDSLEAGGGGGAGGGLAGAAGGGGGVGGGPGAFDDWSSDDDQFTM